MLFMLLPTYYLNNLHCNKYARNAQVFYYIAKIPKLSRIVLHLWINYDPIFVQILLPKPVGEQVNISILDLGNYSTTIIDVPSADDVLLLKVQ